MRESFFCHVCRRGEQNGGAACCFFDMKTARLFLPLIIFVCHAVSGCCLIYDYDNCPPESEDDFDVDSDWKYAPAAQPEGMAYVFFPADGGEAWRFDFPGRAGGVARLPDGEYSVAVFNDDTSAVLFGDSDDYYNFTFYCRRGGLYDGLGGTLENPIGPDVAPGGENVEICPDMLWCDECCDFFLTPEGTALERTNGERIEAGDERCLTMYPRQAVARYRFSILEVSNLGGVARMCASLSGMASSLRPYGMYRGAPVTLPVAARAEGNSAIVGEFLTFGLPSEGAAPNMLSLYVWLADGRKFCYGFDVSGQTRAAADPLNVDIVVSGLELPESGEPVGGGFDVSVDGWVTTIINIQS